MKLTNSGIIALLLSLVFEGGCATYHDKVSELYVSRRKELGNRLVADYDGLYQRASDGDQHARDQIVWEVIELIDINYDLVKKGLYGKSSWSEFAASAAVLGMNAAGTVTGGEELKAILHAASGALEGTSAAFSKSVLQSQGMPAILAHMESSRAEKFLIITKGLKNPVNDYPIGAAVHDLAEYYKAGTFVGAITDIQKTAGAAQVKAEKAIEETRGN